MSTLDDVLDALGAAPRLDAAKCRGLGVELFDEPPHGTKPADVVQRTAAAIAICEGCDARAACSRWLDALPETERPTGVVAGRVVGPGAAQAHKALRAAALNASLIAEPLAADGRHAKRVGVAPPAVAAARRRLEAAGAIPRTKAFGRGGRR